MAKIIYKYPFNWSWADTSVYTPAGKHLLVGPVAGSDCIWTEHTELTNEYQIYPTGGNPLGEHVGSFISGSFVWHVYRV